METYLIIINSLLIIVVVYLFITKNKQVTTPEAIKPEENNILLKTETDNNLLFRLHLPAIRIDIEGLIQEYNYKAKELIPNIEIGKTSEPELIISTYEPQLPFKEAFIQRKIITKKLILAQKQYEMKIIPIYHHSNIDGFYEIFTDITELEELRKSKEQRSKLETIGHLSMGMAHDFNNILQVVIGNAELCLDYGESNEVYVENIETIIQAANKASSLTKQLLIFSRKQEVEFIEMNVNESLTHMRKMISRLIGENITIDLKLSPKPIKIKADEIQFEQIILNLCLNARDAMENGGTIKISTEEIEVKEGDFKDNYERRVGYYLKLSVADTGIGISQEHIEKIFEPFFTTKDQGKGTGLGLSNVQGIVKQYNGFIDIESNIGFGTVFKIYLPIFSKSSIQELGPQIDKVRKIQGQQEKVLLIEDDDLICNVVVKILRKNNFNIIACKDIASASEIIKDQLSKLDLIISDLILPDGDGYSLYKSLKNIHSQVPFIITSGYSKEKEELKNLIDEGILFLRKPFSSDELLHAVNVTLKKEENIS
ncbi:response regulator [bacterium]|nr:response regulator [bacterium]